MDVQTGKFLVIGFPLFFAAVWLSVGTLLGAVSGWYGLMNAYPNRPEEPLLKLSWQFGWMGPLVGINGILILGVCPSGLRVGIWRVFGPFSRSFLVPWADITATRGSMFFMRAVTLRFGSPEIGRLGLRAHLADRLARAAGGRWPEPGEFPPETGSQAFASVAGEWAVQTGIAAAFFTVVPRLTAPQGPWPPLAVAIGFPAVVFGVVALIRLAVRTKR